MLKKVCSLLLAVTMALSLAACGTPEPTEPSTELPTEVPTEVPTQPPTEPATEPPIAENRHPLTGVEMEAAMHERPYAVSVNNTKAAMPMHGISQADVMYEMLVEGSVTRCLAVFTDMEAVEKLGSIRSARIYTVSLVQYLDAILVRAGGSSEADAAIAKLGIAEIDGIKGYTVNAFYRDQARRSAGYSLEHTLFTAGPDLIANAQDRGLILRRETPIDYGLSFAENATPDGENAETIKLWFGSSEKHKLTTMTYDAETGKYTGTQFGEPWIDANTGEAVAYENVLILFARTWVQEDDVHKSIQLVDSGSGYFACNGKIVPIQWSRSGETEPFVYTLEDGTPLTLGVGTSYIGIVPTDAKVIFE